MIIRDIKDDIKNAISKKGFNDGTMQVLHVSPMKYECGDILLVGIDEMGKLEVLVADADDNHFFFYLSDIEENAYITFNRLVDEILN